MNYDLKRVSASIVGYKHELERSFLYSKKNQTRIIPEVYMDYLFPFINYEESFTNVNAMEFDPNYICSSSWQNYSQPSNIANKIHYIEHSSNSQKYQLSCCNIIGKKQNQSPLCFQKEGKNRVELYYQNNKQKIKYNSGAVTFHIFHDNIGILTLRFNEYSDDSLIFSYILDNNKITNLTLLCFPEKTLSFLQLINFPIKEHVIYNLKKDKKKLLNRIPYEISNYFLNQEQQDIRELISLENNYFYNIKAYLIGLIKNTVSSDIQNFKQNKLRKLLQSTHIS